MITISGITVDAIPNEEALLQEAAIYSIEFEYDCKLMICSTWKTRSTYAGLKHFVSKIANSKGFYTDEVRNAFLNSKYITVKVLKTFNKRPSPQELFADKYAYIYEQRTYEPLGYNSLQPTAFEPYEANYVRALAKLLEAPEVPSAEAARQLLSEVELPAAYTGKTSHYSRFVCCYDAETGAFLQKYPTMLSASLATGARTSNIGLCCQGRIRTAGQYIWSYEKVDSVPPTQVRTTRKCVYRYDAKTNKFLDAYPSIPEAVATSGVQGLLYSDVYSVCTGKAKTARGYRWSFEKHDYLPPLPVEEDKNTKSPLKAKAEAKPVKGPKAKPGRPAKRVYSYDSVTGRPAGVYPSVSEAARALGVTPCSLFRACNGKVKTVGGRFWSYTRAGTIWEASEGRLGALTPAGLAEKRRKGLDDFYRLQCKDLY